MIKIQSLSFPPDFSSQDLRRKAARTLGLSPASLGQVRLLRQSVDARKKSDVHYVCTLGVEVDNEERLTASLRSPNLSLWSPAPYVFPSVTRSSPLPPVVVGMGPAGLFAALHLSRAGLRPIVLERGKPVEERTRDVESFWQGGELNEESNVQFGEGGAGTFSDGKLNTGTHDPRITAVLEEFVRHGAPEDILWQQHPHVGTDLLRDVVKSIRQELLDRGCDLRFGHRLSGLTLRGGRLTGVAVTGQREDYSLDCDALVLAVGHSARDTFAMLEQAGVPMEAKPFAIGVRIEHRQELISASQYGPSWGKFPPATYKLACHLPNGRGVFSFCVCPGGQVVAAASLRGHTVTNGMSYRARDGKNINGGLLVGVSPADFPGSDPLAGVRFQEQWEKAAYLPGGAAPAQTVADLLAGRPSKALGGVEATYRPAVTPGNIESCLPPYVTAALREGIPLLDRKLRGFGDGAALLTGVETRSSSPVRILRGEGLQSSVAGLYPCGEGAGYAGGITSAAVDGIRVAEAIATGG